MKKKSNFKYVVLGILAVVAIVGFMNYDKIKFGLSMMKSYKEVKDLEKVVDSNDDEELAVENPLLEVLNQQGSVDNGEDDVDTEDSSSNEDKSNEGKDTSKEEPNKLASKSYITIVSEYNEKFGDLQSEFEGALSGIISNGYAEYKSGDHTVASLANKYLSEGSRLEKQSDAKFNAILKEMEKELKANGHDTSITKDVKAYYNSFKNAKKNSLLSKGSKYVN